MRDGAWISDMFIYQRCDLIICIINMHMVVLCVFLLLLHYQLSVNVCDTFNKIIQRYHK